jgi:Domain of unknown function (DUF4388)
MALQGTLNDLPLVDLIQVLSLQNRTGILSLNCDFSQGQICFSKSKLFSAYVRQESQGSSKVIEGEEAIFTLLGWVNGNFSFEMVSMLPSHNNVHKNWDYLILEFYRREDEQKRKQNLAEMANTVPKLVSQPAQSSVNLNHAEWRLLVQVNGRDSFAEIAARLRWTLEDTVETGYGLQKANLVELLTLLPAVSHSIGEIPTWIPTMTGTPGSVRNRSDELFSQPVMTPPMGMSLVTANGFPQFQPQVASAVAIEKPKVSRHLLAGLIAKIRGS